MAKPKTIGGLTSLQARTLAYVRRYVAEHVGAPAYEEIREQIGSSKASVARAMAQLEDAGLIRRVPGRYRAVEITESGMAVKLPEKP